MLKIAIDVDGTLIKQVNGLDVPRYDVIWLLTSLQLVGNKIYVWSGSGLDYAKRWAEKLGLEEVEVVEKGSFVPDISIDDVADTNLGTVNMKV